MTTALLERPTPARDDGAFVREIREALGLSRKDFARLSQCSERGIADWEAGKPISDLARHQMVQLRNLQQELCKVLEPGTITSWLLTPNDGFDGLKPLEVVERGETHRIWQMLFWVLSGVPS